MIRRAAGLALCLALPAAWLRATHLHPYAGTRFDTAVGLEARGFIPGGAVAHPLSADFVPIRMRASCPAR